MELTARDEAVLRALVRLRVARTRDLVELLFHGVRPDTASRRLRRLFDTGNLDVRTGDRSQPNLYTLGPEGKAWARRCGHSVPRVPRGDLKHHLALVQAWCGMAGFCHRAGAVRLRALRPEWDLRREYGAGHSGVVPDALVELSANGRLLRFALELDRGSERHGEWRRKLARYEAFLDVPTGTELGLVVLADGGERRLAALRGLIGASWPSWFLVEPANTAHAELVLRTLEAAGAPLTPSPCGSGRKDCGSDERTTVAIATKRKPSR